jgi:diketogulonate reductase-like aldo/keto reductase
MDQPYITLNNAVAMPALGLGVLNREQPELTQGAVETALAEGYRLIDTAAAYGNERQVCQAIANSGIDRSELFVTTKLWLTDYNYDSALRAFDASLRRLGLDRVDLYLLHWPVPSDFDATVAAYQAAEQLLAQGRVRAIGVSNFGSSDLKALLDRVEVVPAVNQIELHPFFTQAALREAHQRLGIATEAWSPLGGSVRRAKGASEEPLTPGHRRARREIRQISSTGRAALAYRPWLRCHPEVRPSGPHCSQLRHLRLRADGGRDYGHRCPG